MNDEKNESLIINPQGLEDVSVSCALSEEEFKKMADGANEGTHTLVAIHGGYKGEVKFSYRFTNAGGIFYCYSSQYRITKTNFPGGHKANLHFSFDSLQWWGNDSPDALWQDGEWHSYSRGGWIAANGSARVFARFTFDTPGPDPSADASVTLRYTTSEVTP